MEGFDIEKVESLDFESIKNQLSFIFKSDSDIVNFVNFLKNVQKFVTLSNEKRYAVQMDLTYFRSQIQLYAKKIQSTLNRIKEKRVKAAIKKAKGFGEKITESTIAYYSEEDTAMQGLEELYNVVECWYNYLSDLYFICNSLNKGFNGPSF